MMSAVFDRYYYHIATAGGRGFRATGISFIQLVPQLAFPTRYGGSQCGAGRRRFGSPRPVREPPAPAVPVARPLAYADDAGG